jgi:DNA-binding transcriptional ArsR family regulator
MDETLFFEVFAIKSPVLKILNFLMDNMIFDYSKTDIAEGAGISRTTLSNNWKILEDNGLVVQTREIGRAKMYKLNRDNPIVKKFIELDNAISEFFAAKHSAASVEEVPKVSKVFAT